MDDYSGLIKIIEKVKTFTDFEKELGKTEDKIVKGCYFEKFFELYFHIDPICSSEYTEVYLYKDIPSNLKKYLKLPDTDKGIDAIVKHKNGDYHAVQVKFRKDRSKLAFNKLATFMASSFATKSMDIKKAIIFTNTYEVCDEMDDEKYIKITNASFDICNEKFWTDCIEYLKKNLCKNIIKKPVAHNPLPHQNKLFQIIERHYETHNYGRLYMACGTGKSLMGYFTAVDILKLKKVFIVVPSLYLLSQTIATWKRQTGDNFKFLLIGSDVENEFNNIIRNQLTTDLDVIRNFLDKYKKDNIVVITTYQSSKLLKDACNAMKFIFDIGIYDEAHRTAGKENTLFNILLNGKLSHKRLFMTATEKICKSIKKSVLSMDDESHYGKVIYNLSMRQAINIECLVDYNIISPFITTSDYDEQIIKNEYIELLTDDAELDDETKICKIDLIILIIMLKKTIQENKIHHLLIFSNSGAKAKYIEKILKCIMKDTYIIYMDGTMSMTKRRRFVKEFEQQPLGIISSVKIFGEGVDIPICDSICFIDNKNSTVDIIQYVGRCLRKYSPHPNKKAHIIIPLIMQEKQIDIFTEENESFKKIRKILKCIALSDDMISDVFELQNRLIIKKYTGEMFDKKDETLEIGEIDTSSKINLEELKEKIVQKIFNKDGEVKNYVRNKIIRENYRRQERGEKLIDSKKEYLKFLNKTNLKLDEHPKNWVKFCLGNLFSEKQKLYYYDKENLKNALNRLDLKSFDDYKIEYVKDDKLPPPTYINDGFYYDLDNKLDIMSLVNTINDLDF